MSPGGLVETAEPLVVRLAPGEVIVPVSLLRDELEDLA